MLLNFFERQRSHLKPYKRFIKVAPNSIILFPLLYKALSCLFESFVFFYFDLFLFSFDLINDAKFFKFVKDFRILLLQFKVTHILSWHIGSFLKAKVIIDYSLCMLLQFVEDTAVLLLRTRSKIRINVVVAVHALLYVVQMHEFKIFQLVVKLIRLQHHPIDLFHYVMVFQQGEEETLTW